MLARTDRRRFPILLAVIAALAMAMLFSPVQAQEGSAPDQPTGLEATATHDSVTLTWDDPGDDTITGYVILRRIPAVDPQGQFSELVSDTGTDATTYTDDTVSAETRYTYRIKAINEHGTSERSRWSHIDVPAEPEAAEGDDPDGEDDGGGVPGGPGKKANVDEPSDGDCPNNNTTTCEVDVGGSVTGNIGSSFDEDWFKVVLETGKRYQFDLEGAPNGRGTLPDPYLALYSGSGNFIKDKDDIAPTNQNSAIVHDVTATGTYYLNASGSTSADAGTYTLSVSDITPRSTDATLSALSVTGGGSELVTNFASDTYAYYASAAKGVGQVTVTLEKSDSDATVEYLDSSDAALPDADSTADGHQVTLVVGNTVIKVKVTAEDGTTTQTYTVTVTLAEGSLVSNIGQGSTETHLTTTARSQRFRAGSNEAGYILTGVDVVSGGTHSFTAKVCGVASNNYPTSTCTDLTPQGSFAAGTMSFSAPPNITLSKGTTYAVVLNPVGAFMNYGRTTSEREDKGKQPGSSIANEFEYLTSLTNIWTENNAFSLRIAIKGTLAGDLTPPACTLETGDIWCGVVTVGDIEYNNALFARGYINVTGLSGGGFEGETDIPVGSKTYTFKGIYVPVTGSFEDQLIFRMEADFTSDEKDALELHIDVDGIDSTWPMSDFADSTNEGQMIRDGDDFDWSSATTVTARLREVTRPTVTNVAVTSMPALETDTYGAGETIEVSVTFSEAVDATSNTDFVLSVGGAKRAPLLSGSGTATLVFGYTVVSSDEDTNGIWIGDETRTLVGSRNGEAQNGTITSVATGAAADIEHTELGTDSDHKVDGSRTTDNVAPTLSIADAEGDEDDGVEFTATLTAGVSGNVTATWTASIESGDTASAADLTTTKTGEVEVA